MSVNAVPSMGWTSRSTAATLLLVNQRQLREIASRLAALMDERSQTNESLAYQAGVSVKTVSRLLNAKHEPRFDTLSKVAKALGVDEQELRGPPPPPLGLGEGGAVADQSQLDRIEMKLDQLLEALTEPSEVGPVPMPADPLARVLKGDPTTQQAPAQAPRRQAQAKRPNAA